jgi:hypothetical protein
MPTPLPVTIGRIRNIPVHEEPGWMLVSTGPSRYEDGVINVHEALQRIAQGISAWMGEPPDLSSFSNEEPATPSPEPKCWTPEEPGRPGPGRYAPYHPVPVLPRPNLHRTGKRLGPSLRSSATSAIP